MKAAEQFAGRLNQQGFKKFRQAVGAAQQCAEVLFAQELAVPFARPSFSLIALPTASTAA
jgi:hypothetical protein